VAERRCAVAEPKDRERAEIIIMAWPENIGLAGLIAQALADERARAAKIARTFADGTGQITYSWSKEQSERIAAAIERGETP
jgi:hypothetical protein